MSNAICTVPVSPLRAEASHRSEITTQLVFGEQCTIIDKAKDNWVRVRCSYDNYEGWCQEYQLQLLPGYIDSSVRLTRDWQTELLWNGEPIHVPMGSQVPGLKDGVAEWGASLVKFNGALTEPSTMVFDEASIRSVAMPFLNTGYLWGGKSIYGIDCSGFCQTVFRFFGLFLMRDAYQQATQGDNVGFLQEAKCGDLAFFDNDEGRITHVGILLNDHEIIHSSARVRVDPIDNMGIINRDNRERTHKLRLIKRHSATGKEMDGKQKGW